MEGEGEVEKGLRDYWGGGGKDEFGGGGIIIGEGFFLRL